MSEAPVVRLQNLSNTYRLPIREPGPGAAFKSIFRRPQRDVEAVKEVSFEVAAGEGVGFLGPNGATAILIGSRLFWKTGLEYYWGASA